MDRLNCFSPYTSKAPWHEDQLTRAFLVLVRFSPIVHASFLDLVRERQEQRGATLQIPPLSALSNQTFSIQTQRRSVSQLTGTAISVLMTDEHWTPEHAIGETDRVPVYDGLLYYDPDWILVIENKPWSKDVWESQLNLRLQTDHAIKVDPKLVDLRWADVIYRINGLLERNLVRGAEAEMVHDFVEFVGTHFAYLNPYTSLTVCGGSDMLIRKRCTVILEELDIGPVEYHRGWNYVAKLSNGAARQVWLYLESQESKIVLGMAPGDTLNQAKEFFDTVDRDMFLNLRDEGWTILPNLHFSFGPRHLFWPNGPIGLKDYFAFWADRPSLFGQIKRSDGFDKAFDRMLGEELVAESDRDLWDQKVVNTKRQSVYVCPGFDVSTTWTLADAEALDHGDKLRSLIDEKIRQAMSTWGQTVE